MIKKSITKILCLLLAFTSIFTTGFILNEKTPKDITDNLSSEVSNHSSFENNTDSNSTHNLSSNIITDIPLGNSSGISSKHNNITSNKESSSPEQILYSNNNPQSNFNTSSGKTSSNSSSSNTQVIIPPISSNPIVIDYSTIVELAKTLSEKYKANILISEKDGSFYDDDIISHNIDTESADIALNNIKQELSRFPIGTFKDITIVLCGNLNGQIPMLKENKLLIPCTNGVPYTTLKNLLQGFICDKFVNFALSKGASSALNSFNPKGFYYGYPIDDYVFSQKNIYGGYFVSLKGQQSLKDDLSEIFFSFCKGDTALKLIPKTSLFYDKFKYFCSLLVDFDPQFKTNQIVKNYI